MKIFVLVLLLIATIGIFCFVLTEASRPHVPADLREIMDECRAEGRTPILDRDIHGNALAMRCPPNQGR